MLLSLRLVARARRELSCAAPLRLLSGGAGVLGQCRRALAAARSAAIQSAATPTRGLAAAVAPPAATLRFFVKRPEDADFAEVEVGASASVAALKDVSISKLRVDAPPSVVTLTSEGASTPLDSTLSVSDSVATGALAPHAKLFLHVHAPASAGGAKVVAQYRHLLIALRAARAEPLEGGSAPQSGAVIVRLPAGAEWPQLGAGAPLFVRSFYAGCFEGVLASFDSERAPDATRKFTIVGNAGIGKSAFGSYLLWRAVQAQRTVVYVSNKVLDAFIFHSDGRVEAFDNSEFRPRASSVLRDMSTVLICDGVMPPICSAFTVLITSPVRERWKEFEKCADALRLFFPVFSLCEIDAMWRACFPRLSGAEAEVGVQRRFEKWGGIPRYVLSKLGEDSQELLDNAVTKVNINELFNKLGARELESDIDTSHRLVHFKTAGESPDGTFANPGDAKSYLIARSELGSPYIKRAVFESLDDQELKRLDALLMHVPVSPAAAKLYGDLFEQAALRALLAGGEFDRCELSSGGKDDKLVLLPSSKIFFASAAALASTVRSLSTAELDASVFVPATTNYTAVDAVLGRDRALVNFTINRKHDFKLLHGERSDEGAAPVADALATEDITIYWALPRSRYELVQRRRQPFAIIKPRGNMAQRRVRQYAICVPLGPKI
jgi:hypothetical protein